MADVSVEQIDQAGVELTFNAASAGGDTIPCGERVTIIIANADASATTCTATTTQTVGDLAVDDLAMAVPAGETHEFGPFPKRLFDNGAGRADLAWSNTTSITFACRQL